MKKSKFKFKVGDQVKCTHEDSDAQGPVIARGEYPKGAEAFYYTAGERLYLVDASGGLEVIVEGFLTLR